MQDNDSQQKKPQPSHNNPSSTNPLVKLANRIDSNPKVKQAMLEAMRKVQGK